MKKSHHTQRKVLHYAEQLFAVYGYQKTTIRLLTEKAKVNVAAINHYYGTKEQLYKYLFIKRLRELNTRLAAYTPLTQTPLVTDLDGISAVLLKFAADKPAFMELFFRELSIFPYSICKYSLLRFFKKVLLRCAEIEKHDLRLDGYTSKEKFHLYFQLLYNAHPALRHSARMEKFLAISSKSQFQTISQRMKNR